MIKLDWDTHFFGCDVYSERNTTKAKTNEEYEKLSSGTLVYYHCAAPLSAAELTDLEKQFSAVFLADEKITYQKDPIEAGFMSESIREVSENSLQLEQLAIGSGEYSRFKIDPMILDEKFVELYKIWLQNSLSHTFADIVFSFNEGENQIGLITLTNKNGVGYIGLISIDSNYRGRGIGKKLIQAAEAYFYKQSISQLRVVTQNKNETACRFYEHCGFKEYSLEYIYHLWKK
jgi:dTDP-4-amino-4,6-dideoxy-D-galactose acyltransferase